MKEVILGIAEYAGAISAIIALALILIKPIREKLFGLSDVKAGQKCLLRSEMLSIYYRRRDDKKIRQYEFENFGYLYSAYKALGGNSFIDKIKSEVFDWEVIS